MPSNIGNNKVLLVGAGIMSMEYARVLDAIQISYDVVGRGAESAKMFKEKTGHSVIEGGLDQYFSNFPVKPSIAIVAVSVDQLALVTRTLLEHQITRILVEKPAGLDAEEIASLISLQKDNNASVYVAYNRRFYASVRRASDIIEEDGGLSSMRFEFTEWSHVVEKLAVSDRVKAHWFLANSTHVVDLAFHLGGVPEKISSYCHGSLDWHPKAAQFSGAGVTDRGVLFSYHANWDAPGRWGLELLTRKRRLILRPMEALQVQEKGSVAINQIDLDDEKDALFKPGLYRQVDAFINNQKNPNLLSLENHYYYVQHIYEPMLS